MDEISLVRPQQSGASVKTINLTDYNPDDGVLNLAVLSLFGELGGRVTVPVGGDFWADVSTNQSIRIVIDGTKVGLPFRVQTDGVTKIISDAANASWNGEAVQLEVAFRMVNDAMGINHFINIVFIREGDLETGVSLTMTPAA